VALHQRKYEKDQIKYYFDKVPEWKWKNFEKDNIEFHTSKPSYVMPDFNHNIFFFLQNVHTAKHCMDIYLSDHIFYCMRNLNDTWYGILFGLHPLIENVKFVKF
jgi:hypothetical protein